MRRWQALAIAAATLVARGAAADEPDRQIAGPAGALEPKPPAPAPRSPTKLRRAAAIGAAILPGLVVHGAGSYVLGERRTAKRLLVTSAAGLAVAAVGGLAVGGSRANPYFVWPATPLVVIGTGAFLQTWLADIWVAAGGCPGRGGPRADPPWSLELGTTWLHDAYRERALASGAARLELGRLGLAAGGLLDAQGAARAGELEVRWRLRGAPVTGDRLALRAAGRLHRDNADRVTLATAEIEAVLRAELRHLDPRLAGTFGELSTGLGLERATYAGGAHDTDSLLLGRFAWGAYLGRRGEAAIFYDHRRDHLAGGIYAWRASGFVGSFGATAHLAVAGPWTVRAEVEVGNAWVSTLGLRYQGGAR